MTGTRQTRSTHENSEGCGMDFAQKSRINLPVAIFFLRHISNVILVCLNSLFAFTFSFFFQ